MLDSWGFLSILFVWYYQPSTPLARKPPRLNTACLHEIQAFLDLSFECYKQASSAEGPRQLQNHLGDDFCTVLQLAPHVNYKVHKMKQQPRLHILAVHSMCTIEGFECECIMDVYQSQVGCDTVFRVAERAPSKEINKILRKAPISSKTFFHRSNMNQSVEMCVMAWYA
jgi:hypothetical protein